MGLLHTIKYIYNHPLNKDNRGGALVRFLRWQIGSRLVGGTVLLDFVGASRLLVSTGMHGATMSIYTGLQEFEDMSFVLHLLRENDCFVDIGANVGTYTVLASATVGARTLAVEPIPATFTSLTNNLHINDITGRVIALNLALGAQAGELRFTADQGTVNHAVAEHEECSDVPPELSSA